MVSVQRLEDPAKSAELWTCIRSWSSLRPFSENLAFPETSETCDSLTNKFEKKIVVVVKKLK